MALQIRRIHRSLLSSLDHIALRISNRTNNHTKKEKGKATSSVLFALVALISSSCASLEVTKIEPNKESTKDTLTYCLLVPKIQLIVKEAIVYDKQIDPEKVPLANAGRSITTVTAALIQAPSNKHYYAAHMNSGWFTSDAHRIDYDANGCLNSYNFQTNDQTGTVVSTVASIALAAATVALDAPNKVTDPEPVLTTYLIHQKSRQLLDQADMLIATLGKKPKKNPAETKILEDLLEKAAKLRDLLNPVPTRISKIENQDLYFAPKGQTTDEYVVNLAQKGIKGTQLDENSYVLGVVRRLNQ